MVKAKAASSTVPTIACGQKRQSTHPEKRFVAAYPTMVKINPPNSAGGQPCNQAGIVCCMAKLINLKRPALTKKSMAW